MRVKSTCHIFILLLLIGISYSNTLHSEFVLDDKPAIIENTPIHISEISGANISNILRHSYAVSRPVSNLSMALNYLRGGLDPFGYHLVNILIHMLSAVFVYMIFLEILSLPVMIRYRSYAPEMAFAITGLWCLNPVQTQSLTYIIQRMTSLAGMLYLAAFYCFIRAGQVERKRLRVVFLGSSLLFWLFAMGSKEIAVTFPLVIFLYTYFFFEGRNRTKVLLIQGIVSVVLILICVLVFTRFRNPFVFLKLIGEVSDSFKEVNYTLTQRLLTESRVVFYYISLFLFPLPSRQMLFYDYPISNHMFDPFTTVIATAGIFSLIILAFRMKNRPFISFFIIWYFLNIALESSFIKLDLVFEHRLYLPSIAISAIVVFAFVWMFISGRERRLKSCFVLAGITMLVFASLTFNRNGLWKDQLSLYEDNLKKSPGSFSLRVNLGNVYSNRGMLKEAMEQFDSAIKLRPGHYRGYLNKAVIYSKKELWDDAILYYDKAVRLNPEDFLPYYYKGLVYERERDFKQAALYVEKAVKLNRENYSVRLKLALVYSAAGEIDKSIEHLKKAAKIENSEKIKEMGYTSAYMILGDLYIKKKEYLLAEAAFKNAIKMSSQPDSFYRLGVLTGMIQKRKKEAKEYFEIFLRKSSDTKHRQERKMAKRFLRDT